MHFPQTSYAALASQQTSAGQLATQIVGLPQQQPQQVLTNNGISYIAGQPLSQPQHQMISSNNLSPQILQQLQQHLCSQNVIQPTTQYIISTQGSTAGTAVTTIPSGYQAVQTVGGQQVLIPSNSLNHQIANPVPPQTMTPNNQMVQLLLSNGQVMTTTLANLQAMGLTAPTQMSAPTPQQYSTQIQPNGNIIVSGGQSAGLSPQTQLVTNAAGQVFAITPQLPNQGIQTQPIVTQNPNNTTTQYIQIGGQPMVQQMVQQMVGQQQQQQVANNTALLQQQQQMEENKILSQQHLIQQQMTENAVQHKQSQQMTKSSEMTEIRASDSPNVSNTQTMVSSTTSRPQSLNSSLIQENTSHSSENSEIKTDRISVQSQTSSPSSSNSTMEAESTTHCNLPNKGLTRYHILCLFSKLLLNNRYDK